MLCCHCLVECWCAMAVKRALTPRVALPQLFLITMPHDMQVDMKKLGKMLVWNAGGSHGRLRLMVSLQNANGARFAAADVLFDTLAIRPGCVTPLAVMNDSKQQVKLPTDRRCAHG